MFSLRDLVNENDIKHDTSQFVRKADGYMSLFRNKAELHNEKKKN